MTIDEKVIIKWLKEHLTIEARLDRGYYGDESIAIKLMIGEDCISSSEIYLPSHKCERGY